MSLAVKILALIYGLGLFSAFIILLRNKTVKPFYTTLWLIISLFMLSFVVFEGLYKKLAHILHIENATTFIVVGLISFLFIYVLHLSVRLSEISNRTQELISHCAILEDDIRRLEEDKAKQ